MPTNAIPFLYASIFGIILVAVVPKKEIHRLFIYGLIFGGLFDIVVVSLANLLGEFRITKLGVLKLAHGIIDSIIPFVVWFPVATWGFCRLTKTKNDHWN
jgi:hypothetical protein